MLTFYNTKLDNSMDISPSTTSPGVFIDDAGVNSSDFVFNRRYEVELPND
jgi:hypothetical protein